MVTPYNSPPFPPIFEGNEWAYGWGLIGDMMAVALSLAMLTNVLLEPKRAREAHAAVRSVVPYVGTPMWSPLFLYRAGNISMLIFVVMRSLPDAVWMLAWGEVSDETVTALVLIDLWMDGFAQAPLYLAVLCWTWGRQVIPQQLLSGLGSIVSPRPPWALLWRNGRIIVAVFLLCLGVTIGKAGAGTEGGKPATSLESGAGR